MRLGVTAAALLIWFWTQSLIGGRGTPESGIGDRLHQPYGSRESLSASAPVRRQRAADRQLEHCSIYSELFLLSMWVFRGELPAVS